jgi:hypothetical protein
MSDIFLLHRSFFYYAPYYNQYSIDFLITVLTIVYIVYHVRSTAMSQLYIHST